MLDFLKQQKLNQSYPAVELRAVCNITSYGVAADHVQFKCRGFKITNFDPAVAKEYIENDPENPIDAFMYYINDKGVVEYSLMHSNTYDVYI